MSNIQVSAYVLTGEPYLIEPPVRLIQETKPQKSKIHCSDNFPCKLMTCHRCKNTRRDFFINNGSRLANIHNLDTHIIVTWKVLENGCPWFTLRRNFYQLNSKLSGKIGKFIRVIAIGQKTDSPHAHFLINHSKTEAIVDRAKQYNINDVNTVTKHCYSPDNLLGYFFDQNFIPTFLNSERPKGIRLISGSRGMRYGFPPIKKN